MNAIAFQPSLSSAHLQILSALLRLARKHAPATLSALEARCDLSASELAKSVAELNALGLLTRPLPEVRLSMSGFALAVMVAGRASVSQTSAKASSTRIRRAA
jgi:RIO-like serine/threonine protein kinase